MLLKVLKRSRKGNLIAILLFAVMISIMSMGSLSVASTLYTSNEESAQNYANIQTYRSAAEIACYKYIMDLQTVTVTKDMSSSILGSVGPTIYTEAIELIQGKIARSDDELVWKTETISDALTGTVLSDPSIMLNMLAKLDKGNSKFKLSIADYPQIDWASGESFISAREAQLRIEPIEVIVDLQVRGEVLREVLFVDGLRLLVTADKDFDPDVGTVITVTLKLVEREGGVQIYRD